MTTSRRAGVLAQRAGGFESALVTIVGLRLNSRGEKVAFKGHVSLPLKLIEAYRANLKAGNSRYAWKSSASPCAESWLAP